MIFNVSPSNNLASLKDEANIEEDFSYVAIDKETKTQQGEINTQLLHATEVETVSYQEKDSGAAPMDSVTARFPDEKKVDDNSITPLVEEKGEAFYVCFQCGFFDIIFYICFVCAHACLLHLPFPKQH